MELAKHWAASLEDYVIDLAWSPDSGRLAAASAAGPITLFRTTDGTVAHHFEGHEMGTNCLAFAAPAGSTSQWLASGGQDGAVKIWDATAGQHSSTTTLGTAWVDHIGWSATSLSSEALARESERAAPSTPILAAAAGRSLNIVAADGTLRKKFPDTAKTISAIAWHPSGGCVADASFGSVRLWDSDDFLLQKDLPYNNGIHALVWSPDGKWLVSGNQDPSVHLWVPEADLELHMSGYEGKVKHLSFDKTSRWLATSGGRDACIWDCSGNGPEGREPAMLPHESPICAVTFQKDHGLLATAAQDGVVNLWSPERKQPLRATVKLPTPATKLAWSPNDQYLAIGSSQGVVYVLRASG
jgi:WD40 repeat protein